MINIRKAINMETIIANLLPLILMRQSDSMYLMILYMLIQYIPKIVEYVKKYKTNNGSRLSIVYEKRWSKAQYDTLIYYLLTMHGSCITKYLIDEYDSKCLSPGENFYITYNNQQISISSYLYQEGERRSHRIDIAGNRTVILNFSKYIEKIYNSDSTIMVERSIEDNEDRISSTPLIISTNPKTYLSKDIETDIFAQLDAFMASEKYYAEHGVTYKCGLLLKGPPGTGKSTLANVLAIKYNMSLKILSKDIKLERQYGKCIRNRIILFDDIDLLGQFHRETDTPSGEKQLNKMFATISFSDLLEFLDGKYIMHRCIIILTTNDVNKVNAADPALFRPGRIDWQYEIKACNEEHLRKILMEFFEVENIPSKFNDKLKKMGSWNLTISDMMQSYLIPSGLKTSEKYTALSIAIDNIYANSTFNKLT